MNHPLVQVLLHALMVFGACKFLARHELGWWVVVVLVATSAGAAVVTYVLRFNPARLAKAAETPGLKQFIEQVAKWAKLQPPGHAAATAAGAMGLVGLDNVPPSSSSSTARRASASGPPAAGSKRKGAANDAGPADFALRRPEDFEAARSRIGHAVRGHDAACTQILSHLEQSLVLRLRQDESVAMPPLGAFLLAGAPGTGKRHLATAVAQLLYTAKNVISVDLSDFDGGDGIQDVLANRAADNAGAVFAAVKARPYHAVILQNVDRANAKGIELLTSVLGTGTLTEAGSNAPVSFQQCTFFLTTSKSLGLLRAIRDKRLPRERFLNEVRDALAADTAIGEPLLSRLTDLVVLDEPTPWVKAEVVAMLMERESRKFGVSLDYVDPGILAAEAEKVTDAHGFEPVPGRVAALLRTPLYKASRRELKRLILEPEEVETAAASGDNNNDDTRVEYATQSMQRGWSQ